MAYLTVNQHQITRKIGLAEPEKPPVESSQWSSTPNSTTPLSMDEIAAALRAKNRLEMFPPAQKTRAVVYCSQSEQAKRPTGEIPEIYASTCRRLGLPAEHLGEAFGDEGFPVEKCFSAWKGGQSVLEVWKVNLHVSPVEPLLKIHFLKHNTYKLLLPDIYLQPLTHPHAVDCFANYQWPNGDRELFDTRHTYCVVDSFRNVREPLLFVSDDQLSREKLTTILTVVTELAKVEHCARRGRFNERALPTCVGRAGDPAFDVAANEQFAALMHEAALRLGTTGACAKFWRRYRRTWVFLWTGKKYQGKKYYLTVHRSSPHLMFVKHDGRSKTAFALDLDYTSHSLSRGCSSLQQKKSWSSFMRSPKVHMAFIDHFNDRQPRTFFSFETSENLKDFQQLVATLGYLQLRLEACPVTNSNLDQYLPSVSGGRSNKQSFAAPSLPAVEEEFEPHVPQYYASPMLTGPRVRADKDGGGGGSSVHLFTKSYEDAENSSSTAGNSTPRVSPDAYAAGTLKLRPRRAPMGTLFSRPLLDDEDSFAGPPAAQKGMHFVEAKPPAIRSPRPTPKLVQDKSAFCGAADDADSGSGWEDAFYASSPRRTSPMKGDQAASSEGGAESVD